MGQVSSCMTSTEESVQIEIKNELPDLEKKMIIIIEDKIVPLIEKVVCDYIDKRFPKTQPNVKTFFEK
jgi:hypothetical protein